MFSYTICKGPQIDSVSQEKRIYFQCFLNTERVVANLDQGADISLIHRSYKQKLRMITKGILKKPSITSVTSFSNHPIPILSEWEVDTRLSRKHPPLLFTIYVIPDIPGSPPLLIGEDFLLKTKASLTYVGDEDNTWPEITINFPIKAKMKIIYEKPTELDSCYSEATLLPLEQKVLEFKINPGSFLARTDFILITNRVFSSYHIVPSRTEVEFSFKNNSYIGTALVINLTNTVLENIMIFGKIECVNKAKVFAITQDLSPALKRELMQNNFAREILASEDGTQISCLQINSLNAERGSFYDTKESENIFDSTETFSEIATFKDEIIEPQKGIDCPTIIIFFSRRGNRFEFLPIRSKAIHRRDLFKEIPFSSFTT